MTRASVASSLLLGLVAALAAQEPQPSLTLPAGQQPVFRTGITGQVLNVSVLDSRRMPVRDLTLADFVVTEEKKARPILAVSEVDLSRPSPTVSSPRVGAATSERSSPLLDPGRLVVILFDRTIVDRSQQMARQAAVAVVDGLGPNDFAAVVFSTGGKKPQTFTADRELLRTAIRQPMAAWPELDSEGNPERGNPGECLCGLCTLETIERVANVLKEDTMHRKVLVLVGREIGIGEWWYDPVSSPPTRSQAAPTAQDCRARISRQRGALERAIRTANLTIHTFNPDGLETGIVTANSAVRSARAALLAGDFAEGRRYRQDTRFMMANLGGGRAFESNDPLDVREIFSETSSYYLVAFEPLPATPGKDHQLEVLVSRKGLTVQAQRILTADTARTAGQVIP